MSRREGAVAALALAVLIGGCAHSGAATAASRSGEHEASAALRRCTNGDCDELDAMFRSKLSAPLRARITQAIARGDDPIVARATARCRGGSDAICGVLWWVLDRLYLDDDASTAHADECPLTRAFFDATAERAAPLVASKGDPAR
jgi:hypothetical protein